MPLSPGTQLGPYKVLALLGAGGMGEVYRARDPRLDREVAIKVLPHDRVADEARRQRFIQEAKAASALNHPHIVTIHEIESANGIDFIVMELVRGKSLDALIPRQGMRLGEVLRIAIPVADALAAAHARGIVHRDLKPANVMVGTDGAVKVLDFGLAKLTAVESAPDGETITVVADPGLSAPGTIMGTAAYMSPEQASGAKLDQRSDIFSFGAMLYEMTTGHRAFSGKTHAETLSAVMQSQPAPPRETVPDLPYDLERAILRCLRKDPIKRFQTMADVRVDLAEIKEASDSGLARPPVASPVRRRPWILAALGLLGVTLALVVWRVWWQPMKGEEPPEVAALTTLSGISRYPALSNDGEEVAFSWDGDNGDNFDIYLKLIGSPDVRRLTSDPAGDFWPSWSPDGRQIAFLRCKGNETGCRIHVTSPIGGSDRKLSDFPANSPLGWTPDGRFIVAGRALPDRAAVTEPSGLFLIPASGGEPRSLVAARAPRRIFSPAYSFDGHSLAYALRDESACWLYVCAVDSNFAPAGPSRRLVNAPTAKLSWSRDGRSIIYDGGDLLIQSHLWRVAVDGLSSPAEVKQAGFAGEPATLASRDRLAFSRTTTDIDIFTLHADGTSEGVAVSSAGDVGPDISADNHQFAFSSGRAAEVMEIWVAGIRGENVRQLTHGPGSFQGSPSWSPDGHRVAFDSRSVDRDVHVWVIDEDGGGLRQLTTSRGGQTCLGGRGTASGSTTRPTRDRAETSGACLLPVARQNRSRTREAAKGAPILGRQKLLYKPPDTDEAFGDAPLLMAPIASGAPIQLVGCVHARGFAESPSGVYYAACDSGSSPTLHVINPSTRQDRVLGRLEDFYVDLTVSPDEKTVLYNRMTNASIHHGKLGWRYDLMMIDNFK